MAPESFPCPRLLLRRPTLLDAEAIFARYASDADVTRLLAWPRHRDLGDTLAFLAWSDACWARDGVGPYLVTTPDGAEVLGSTGLERVDATSARVGYLLVPVAQGRGLATEALRGVVHVARAEGLRTLIAEVHPDNAASLRLLDDAGFVRVSTRRMVLPNLGAEAEIEEHRLAI